MRKLALILIFFLLFIGGVSPVLADDSVSPTANITDIKMRPVCDGPQCEGYNYSHGIYGTENNIDASMPGLNFVWGDIYPESNDQYNIELSFINGDIITGEIDQNSFLYFGKQNNVTIEGKSFNTTWWGLSQHVYLKFGIDSGTGIYYLLISKYGSLTRLEIPLTYSLVENPVISIKVNPANGGSFYYNFVFESNEYLYEDIAKSIPSGETVITQLLEIIGIFWVIIIFLFGPGGLFDWLFIHAGILWIFLMIETGMMMYYSLTSKNIFIFYQRIFRGNKTLLEFIINIAQGTLTTIKMAVDLVNPLRWIFG